MPAVHFEARRTTDINLQIKFIYNDEKLFVNSKHLSLKASLSFPKQQFYVEKSLQKERCKNVLIATIFSKNLLNVLS